MSMKFFPVEFFRLGSIDILLYSYRSMGNHIIYSILKRRILRENNNCDTQCMSPSSVTILLYALLLRHKKPLYAGYFIVWSDNFQMVHILYSCNK